MRKLTPAYVMTSVVVALAATAVYAQSAPRSAAPASASTSVMTNAPRPAVNAASTTTPPAGSRARVTGFTPENTTGSRPSTATGTSTSIGNSTVLTNADGSISTTTLNADGTRTIATVMPDGTKTTTTLPERFTAVINGAPAGVTVDGERLVAEPNGASTVDTRTAFEIQDRALLSVEVQRSSASLDRVIKDAAKDRRKVGKNGQLLHSIAPRTNVDRSDEMPDDGPTPALSGLSNSLIRR